MMRRECYEKAGGYREEFYYAQDSDLWRRLGHIGKIGYVQKILYSYRVTTGSISGSKGAGQTAYDRLAHACHKARLQGGDETEILEKARLLNCTGDFKQYKGGSLTDYFIARCLLANHDGRARKYLWKAIRQNPWHVRAWVSLLRCFA